MNQRQRHIIRLSLLLTFLFSLTLSYGEENEMPYTEEETYTEEEVSDIEIDEETGYQPSFEEKPVHTAPFPVNKGESYTKKREELKKAHPYPFSIEEENTHEKSEYLNSLFSFVKNLQEIGIYILVAILIICIIAFCAVKLLHWNGSKTKNTKMDDDELSIHHTYTNEEVNQLLANGNYKEAIKIVYIRTLQLLNEKGIIAWTPYKTPIEFYYEVKDSKVKKELMELTSSTMAVRYGNVEATINDYERATLNYNGIKNSLQ